MSPGHPFQSVEALSGGYEIGEIVNSPPSVSNSSLHQGMKVPLHSPLIVLDDCDDNIISFVADSSIPVEGGGTLEDNVQDDQSTNIDVATREVSAVNTIDSSSQPMVRSSEY